MRNVEAAFGVALSREVTTLALCWRVTRSDGVATGFTTHDRALSVGGIVHAPSPGIAPSAVTASDGFDVATMEVAGALTGAAISERDLAAGRYDGARVELFLVDWEASAAGVMMLAEGSLGSVECADGRFTAELRGATRALDAVPIELLSPECRAEFGDRRCRVALAAHEVMTTVSAVAGAVVTVAGGPYADGDFAYGRLRLLDRGVDAEIAGSVGGALRLREALSVAAGERVAVRAGCDKRFSTCVGRFGNGENFRGEPHVPGMDALLRYPGV